ncbi:MAG: hypothetical protein GVY16_03580 [Planctomycetes bacterium]|nr:hypothetical protein [Planctomycetota bacterium]
MNIVAATYSEDLHIDKDLNDVTTTGVQDYDANLICLDSILASTGSYIVVGGETNIRGQSQSGAPGDSLIINSSTAGRWIITFTNSDPGGHDGTVDLDGTLIKFCGLEPLSIVGTPATGIRASSRPSCRRGRRMHQVGRARRSAVS